MMTIACVCGGVFEIWWLAIFAVPFIGKWIKKKVSKKHDKR